MAEHPSRRDFLRLTSVAGLAPALQWPCLPQEPRPTVAPAVDPARLEELLPKQYLCRGIQALSQAHRGHWAEAHHGAAILAGWFFCREKPLDERTIRAVRTNLDAYIAWQPAFFGGAIEPGGKPAAADRIVETIAGHMSELRGAAHDQIFAALAVKALQAAPEMAVASIVDGVCKLLTDFRERFRPSDNEHDRRHPLPPYAGDQDLIRATFAALARPRAHLARLGVVGVIHWVTHADALLTLAEFGYPDVARRGYAAHQAFVNHAVVGSDVEREAERNAAAAAAGTPASAWLAADWWESEAPRRPRSGTWLNGHTLKLPYSLFRLRSRLQDPAAARGIDQAPWLIEEFERGRM